MKRLKGNQQRIRYESYLKIKSDYEAIIYELARLTKKLPWEIDKGASPGELISYYSYLVSVEEAQKEENG